MIKTFVNGVELIIKKGLKFTATTTSNECIIYSLTPDSNEVSIEYIRSDGTSFIDSSLNLRQVVEYFKKGVFIETKPTNFYIQIY